MPRAATARAQRHVAALRGAVSARRGLDVRALPHPLVELATGARSVTCADHPDVVTIEVCGDDVCGACYAAEIAASPTPSSKHHPGVGRIEGRVWIHGMEWLFWTDTDDSKEEVARAWTTEVNTWE